MVSFRTDGMGVTASGQDLVKNVTLSLSPGELVILLGPNGAGKTMLLRAGLGLIAPSRGTAQIDGRDSSSLSPLERARAVSYLPQTRPLAWPVRVRDVVALGRYAYGAAPSKLGETDKAAISRAMAACDIEPLAQRKADTLSGGELARVHLARAFAAETPLLIADEPVAALDPRHQFRVMDMLRAFVASGGGALVVLHDIDLASRYADRLVWMKDGRVLADGPPADTLTPDRIAEVYGVEAQVTARGVMIEGVTA